MQKTWTNGKGYTVSYPEDFDGEIIVTDTPGQRVIAHVPAEVMKAFFEEVALRKLPKKPLQDIFPFYCPEAIRELSHRYPTMKKTLEDELKVFKEIPGEARHFDGWVGDAPSSALLNEAFLWHASKRGGEFWGIFYDQLLEDEEHAS